MRWSALAVRRCFGVQGKNRRRFRDRVLAMSARCSSSSPFHWNPIFTHHFAIAAAPNFAVVAFHLLHGAIAEIGGNRLQGCLSFAGVDVSQLKCRKSLSSLNVPTRCSTYRTVRVHSVARGLSLYVRNMIMWFQFQRMS